MTQADDFGFGEEAALLKESARKFFSDNCSVESLHKMVAGDPTPERMTDCFWDRDLWQQMVDLGWTMLAVPESAGGLGMPMAAVAGLMEEVGRAALPSPLLSTLNATWVLAACGAGGEEALADIIAGSAATLAITDEDGGWDNAGGGVSWRYRKLNGTAWFVQDTRKADRLLVGAQTDAGVNLFWVAVDAPGVTVQPDAILDLTRDQAHIRLHDVPAQPLSGGGQNALDSAMPAIWTALAADITGAAEWQLQTTVEYVNTRQQFDHSLGFFQAVKHPLVDVMLQIDQTKSLVYNAAAAIDSEPGAAARFAHMAKASASETAAFASGRSVQYHGGIGFTWECFVHLYFKRQKHSQMLFGDAAWHRAHLADTLIGEVA